MIFKKDFVFDNHQYFSILHNIFIGLLLMLGDFEKRLNNRLLDWIIGGSYLGDYRQKFFEKLKKIGLEAYTHILIQIKRLKDWYKD